MKCGSRSEDLMAWRRPPRHWVLVGCLATMLHACVNPESAGGEPGQVRVTLTASESVEYLATDGEALHQVVSGAIVSAGVVLAERGAQSLRFYDSAGTLVRSLGGPGDGPGEFRDILWVRRLDDRLAVYDPTLRRLTDVGFDGALRQVSTVSLPDHISGADLMGMFGDGTSIAAALRHNFPQTGVGAYRHGVAAYRIDVGRGRADSLFNMLGEEQFISRGRPNFLGPVPYGAPSWISVADSVAYALDNVNASVSVWSMNGTLVDEILVPGARRERVTATDVSVARDRFIALTTSARVDWLRFFDAMPIPDSTPFFGWGGEAPIKPLLATADGYVFVTHFGGVRESATRIAVFDPRRRFLGDLMFEVEARVLDLRGGLMLVQSWDADGVETVRLVPFPFERESGIR